MSLLPNGIVNMAGGMPPGLGAFQNNMGGGGGGGGGGGSKKAVHVKVSSYLGIIL